jgi:hypothetical protein
MENKKTTGIIATIVAVLLCGCPGLLALFMGATFAVVSQVPGAEIDLAGRTDPAAALNTGLGLLCLGGLFVLIPVVVAFLTLRRRPAAGAQVYTPPPDEPVPPAG